MENMFTLRSSECKHNFHFTTDIVNDNIFDSYMFTQVQYYSVTFMVDI